jgi:2-polyprenyl-3-methyl-5-hydroxy-6-metoxy-1,4-benzoquinol methylase
MERLAAAHELLDGPLDERTLVGNLRDLRRANHWLGGAELSWRALHHVRRVLPEQPSLSLLDVGTGSADIPLALLRRASASDLHLEVTATDVRPEIVDHARRHAGGHPALSIALSRGQALGQPPASFDIVHASLVVHHLEPPGVARLLTEMGRVARHAVIINDLVRARRWWAAAWLASRLTTANRYTRHDAPLSVRRAYQPSELEALAVDVGLRPDATLYGLLGHRYALVLRPTASAKKRR